MRSKVLVGGTEGRRRWYGREKEVVWKSEGGGTEGRRRWYGRANEVVLLNIVVGRAKEVVQKG